MKVNQDMRVVRDHVQRESKVQHSMKTDFYDLVKLHGEKLQSGELQSLLAEIEKAGDRLAKSRNFKDLTKYKSLIQRFIKQVSEFGIGLKKSSSWDSFGQSRTLKIIEKIDKKLVELTDELLKNEKDNIQVLHLIGEIKGLIINLYS